MPHRHGHRHSLKGRSLKVAPIRDAEDVAAIRAEIDGVHHAEGMATPAEANHNIDDGLPF